LCKKNSAGRETLYRVRKLAAFLSSLRARAEEAEVAPTAKNSREVTCVYGPPQYVVEEAAENKKFIHI
jgi:hypothetical protein